MVERSLIHDTLVFERHLQFLPATVFTAWADPYARKQWAPPSSEMVLMYQDMDFRVGGNDIFRCGDINNMKMKVENRYLDIVQFRRIVFAETIHDWTTRLSAALVTAEFDRQGITTDFRLTVQIAAFGSTEIIDGNRAGWTASLDNLERYLMSLRRSNVDPADADDTA